MDPETAPKLRRLRRIKWGFRAIFYPGAALVAVLLLTSSRGSASDGGSSVTMTGRTSQDHAFLTRVSDGTIDRFEAVLTASCDIGGYWRVDWYPVAGRQKFDWDGTHLRVREEYREESVHWTATIDAKLEGHRRFAGTLTLEASPPGARCSSGPIPFSVDADR